MKSLFDPAAKSEIFSRIEKLRHDTKPVWGKMNSGQMLAHNTAALEYACGDWTGKQIFIGKIIGSFMKKSFYNDKPYSKNSPTSPRFIISNQREFESEKVKLLAIVTRYHDGGPDKSTKSPHMFFGNMPPEHWGMGMYKHLDHHLTQFGV